MSKPFEHTTLGSKIASELATTRMGALVIQDDELAAQKVLELLFGHLGMPMTDENFSNTPARWLKAIKHYIQPYDAKEDLGVSYLENKKAVVHSGDAKFAHSMVIQTPIPYRALCAHHLLPVHGEAHVAYIPNGRVVGLSKLSRIVYGISHRMPSLQEHVCTEVVEALVTYLQPLGAACVIDAHHGCMECRGVEEVGIRTITSHVSGVFEIPAARAEFMGHIHKR